LENGGKLVLPTSALEELSGDLEKFSHPFFGGLSHSLSGSLSGGQFQAAGPMLFEVSTGKGKRTFCGVEEFTAAEGVVCVPKWVLQTLELKKTQKFKSDEYHYLKEHTSNFNLILLISSKLMILKQC